MSEDQIASSKEDATRKPGAIEEGKEGEEQEKSDDQPRVRRKRMGVDPSLIISEERSKRRKSPTPTPEGDGKVKKEDGGSLADPKDPEKAAVVGKDLYDKLLDVKDREGEQLAEPFMKLPNKRSFPDYYETIKHPMSLEMVHQKLVSKSYETVKDVVADLGQIFNNAKRYNTKESLLFQWAKRLHKITRTFYANITNPGEAEPDSDHEDAVVPGQGEMSVEREMSRGMSETIDNADMSAAAVAARKKRGTYMREGPTTYKLLKPVLKAIKDARSTDGDSREVAGIFLDLPDRRELPDYYKVITQPICLREIEARVMNRKYERWEEFFDEAELMCANAFKYNEDDSEVYADAQQIKKILDLHRHLIQNRLAQGTQTTKFKVDTNPGMSPREYRAGTSAEPTYQSPAPSRQTPTAPAPAQYLPALPKGVVTEEVVASLNRYPLYEQQAWAQSLPPVSMQIYRQIQASNEARRRIAEGQGVGSQTSTAPPPPLPQLAELPSAGRPGGMSKVPNRQAPPLPSIRCLDFAFSSSGATIENRQAIRLHNMRGVVSHAVVVGAKTTDVELTAYIADPPKNTTSGEVAPGQLENVPEVSIRINGNQGHLPRFIFSGDQKDRPAGMRWVVSVPSIRAETKIEITATKPGALAEISSIYINRQM